MLFANTVGDQRGDQRLVAPIDINPGTLPELTMGAWVRTDTLNSDLYKFMGHDNGAWDRTVGLDNRQGAFRYTAFTGTNNNGPVDATPAPVNTTDWTFVAAVYDSPNNTVTVYVDLDVSTIEALVAVTEPALMGPGQGTVSVGSLRPDNNAEGWVGSLDNVFFFDEALTETEVTALRDGGKLAFVGSVGDPGIFIVGGNPFGDLTDLGAGPDPIARSVSVMNTGEDNTLELTRVEITGPDAGFYTLEQPVPSMIAPETQQDINITLNAPAAGGNLEASLEIESNDAENSEVSLSLNATITSDPNLEVVVPDPLFGTMVFNAPPGIVNKTIF